MSDRDYCSIADPGCEAPAGFRVNGIATANPDPGETFECPSCSEPVCENCSTEGVCANCVDHFEKIASASP